VLQVYQPLANELVNAAFVSVWDEMYMYETFDIVDDVLLVKPLEIALQGEFEYELIPSASISHLQTLSESVANTYHSHATESR
jgi:hypothetical protein